MDIDEKRVDIYQQYVICIVSRTNINYHKLEIKRNKYECRGDECIL